MGSRNSFVSLELKTIFDGNGVKDVDVPSLSASVGDVATLGRSHRLNQGQRVMCW